MGSVHWYRKDFRLPRASEASKWVLRFESVNYRARVWLNGKPLGNHVGAYLPFELRAKSVRRRGTNRLVVRVDSRRQKFDIPPLSQRASGAFEGGWWNYNGILREVYLRRVDQFDFAHVVYLPSLRCRTCAATIRVQVTVRNVNTRGAQGAHHRARSDSATCASARTACRAAARTASAPACGSAIRACGAPSGRTCTRAACSCAPRAGGSCRSTRSTRGFATCGSAGSGASS